MAYFFRPTIFSILSVLSLISFSFFSRCENLWAENQEPVVLDPVIVSASRIPAFAQESISSTTRITREDIAARQPANAVDLLRNIPGLHIDQPGSRGGVSSLYLRGADPNFTVVMMDGVKLNDPTGSRGGGFDFALLDPANIESIEIVSGPLSSLYGSDAMGGIINIITRGGRDRPYFSSEIGGGSKGGKRGRLSTGGPLGTGDYALHFSYVDDGTPIASSRFEGKNLHAQFRATPTDHTWLKLTSYYGIQDRESFPDDSGGPRFAVLRETDQRDLSEWNSGLSFGHTLNNHWAYEMKADFFARHEKHASPGVAPGLRDPFGIPRNRSDTHFRRSRFLFNGLASPTSTGRISFGAEAQYEKGKSDDVIFFSGVPVPSTYEISRANYAAFLETRYGNAQGLLLEGSLRRDDAEDFDAEWSPRLGASYHITATDTTLKTTWGEGFKLASFFALGNAIVGNPTLRPETSESFDIGFVQNLMAKRLTISSSFFHNRFFDLIDFNEGPPPRLVNQNEVTALGGEAALDFQVSKTLSATSHLSYTETKIKNSNDVLRNRPKWRGGFNLHWQPKEKLSTQLALLYLGKVHDSAIPTGDRTLKDYTRVDVGAAWSWSSHWRLSVAVDNLFDTHYKEAVGFPAPGMRLHFALRFAI